MLAAVASALPQLLEAPSVLGHADDRDIERAALDHRLQRRKYLLVGEIACGAEEDQCIASIVTHRSALPSPPLSRDGRQNPGASQTAASPENPRCLGS